MAGCGELTVVSLVIYGDVWNDPTGHKGKIDLDEVFWSGAVLSLQPTQVSKLGFASNSAASPVGRPCPRWVYVQQCNNCIDHSYVMPCQFIHVSSLRM